MSEMKNLVFTEMSIEINPSYHRFAELNQITDPERMSTHTYDEVEL